LTSILSAKCSPVTLCLTSFTRPKPPVPVSQLHQCQTPQSFSTHVPVQSDDTKGGAYVPMVMRISRSSRLAYVALSWLFSKSSEGRTGREGYTGHDSASRSLENIHLNIPLR
jgi:hypothetical protein